MNGIEEKDVGQPSYFHFPPSFTLLLLPGNFLIINWQVHKHISGDASNKYVAES